MKTVEATSQAQREAKIRVIQAEQEAQKAVIEQKNKIVLDALRKERAPKHWPHSMAWRSA